MSFTRISIIVVLAAVVVYFGLTFLLPHHKDEVAKDSSPTPDQVFGSNTAAAPAASPDTAAVAAAAETPAGSATTDAAPAPAATTETAKPAEAAASTTETSKPSETVAAADSTPSSETSAAAPASEPAQSSESAPSTAAPTEEPAAAPADAGKTMTASPPKHHTKHAHSADVATVSHSKSYQPKDAAVAWWPDSSKQSSDGLNLVYAGEAAYARAIVLLFSADLSDAAAAGSHVKVYTRNGKAVSGNWALGKNPRMLVLDVKSDDRYTVVVEPGVSDAQGKTLSSRVFGPVYVH